MFAVIAAVLFGLALLLELIDETVGELVTPMTLLFAGLLCFALHFAVLPRGRWRRR